MRILYIDVNCKGSSTGKIVYDLFQETQKKGHDSTICYGRGRKVDEPEIYKFGIDFETGLHAVLARITGYNGYYSPISTNRLIKYIDNYKPDVIHIHELHAYFVNIVPLLRYIKKKRIPLVWTFHCEYMYTGKCGYAYDCLKFKEECGECPLLKEYPKSFWLDKTKQMLKMKKELLQDLDFTVVTPSEWLANRVRMSFLRNKTIRVVHNGVDTSIFYPRDVEETRRKYGVVGKNKVVLFVTPDINNDRKGGKWVLQLAEEMKNENYTFVLVGKGGEKKNNKKNIIYTGGIYDEVELAYLYSAADVLLLCSEKETYSMTCAEAISCGTPVVGFKCGAPETVFSKPYAIFVEYGNVNELKRRMMEQVEKGKVPEAETKKYSNIKMATDYIELYEAEIRKWRKK